MWQGGGSARATLAVFASKCRAKYLPVIALASFELLYATLASYF